MAGYTVSVNRPRLTSLDVLRGLTLKRIGERATESIITTPTELGDALAGVFGLDIGRAGEQARSKLWTRVHAAHLEWEATGRA